MINNFSKVTPNTNHRLIISICGRESSGKTSFALSAPGPILYFNLDCGAEGVIDKFLPEKEIYEEHYQLSIFGNQTENKATWAKFKTDYTNALESKAKTIVIDTSTEFWALNRLAVLGKVRQVSKYSYLEVNSEHTSLLNEAFKRDKNLILINKVKAVWENEQKTDKVAFAGYSQIPYIVQVDLEAVVEDNHMINVIKCRPNDDLRGMSVPIDDPLTGFDTLYSLIYGG